MFHIFLMPDAVAAEFYSDVRLTVLEYFIQVGDLSAGAFNFERAVEFLATAADNAFAEVALHVFIENFGLTIVKIIGFAVGFFSFGCAAHAAGGDPFAMILHGLSA